MISTIVEIEHIKDFAEQGFYSKTYLANDKRLKRQVAVKDIVYENLTSDSDFEKYFEEAYKLSIATHPRVLPVFYVGLDHGEGETKIPRIVTPYFKHGSLNAYLQKVYSTNQTLALDEVIRYAHDIIQGMAHLHSLDILHLDLKASNIYIGDDLKMVLGDFGQARFIKAGIVHDKVNLYPVLSPIESLTKKAIDKTTDIYQFGLLLYSMLCYNKYREAIETTYQISTAHLNQIYRVKPDNVEELSDAFKANMKLFATAIKSSSFPNRTDYPYYIPPKIQEIIHKCLAPKVEDRYNNFYQIQADLNDFTFPKGVTEFHQNLLTNNIHFIKDEKPCIISVTPNGAKFDITSSKNDRNSSDCTTTNISPAKLSSKLFTFADEM